MPSRKEGIYAYTGYQKVRHEYFPSISKNYLNLRPTGTVLPADLICLHEYKDHYSLQCTRPMPLPELNRLLTKLVQEQAECMTTDEFLDQYEF